MDPDLADGSGGAAWAGASLLYLQSRSAGRLELAARPRPGRIGPALRCLLS